MENEIVDLWLKAGTDGVRQGGDPICQQIFMVLIEKSLNPESRLKFDAKTVNESRPPPEFLQAGLRHTPSIKHGDGVTYSHPDEILEYIDRTFPIPSLKSDDQEANNASNNLFRAFAFFIKQVNNDPKNLEFELSRLDNYLKMVNTKFLTGDNLTHIDCYVLPKLHTIRIAASALKKYEIPINLKYLWNYLKVGYESEAFKRSCPSDQEIIFYWAERSVTPNLSGRERSQLFRSKPTFNFSIPSESDNDNTREK